MRWIEAAAATTSRETDAICDRLTELGIEGMSIEDETDFREFLANNHKYWDYVDDELTEKFAGVSRVKFYLEDGEEGRRKLSEIRDALNREIQVNYIEDEDWANSWKSCYEPLPIGERLMVVPEWLEPEPGGRIALRLDPGIAFGTGSHPTTRMCLEALEEYAAKGKKVLDLGCGSGILGIGALLLGCDRVKGCDIDPKSPDAARRNAALNGIDSPERFDLCTGDVLSDEGMRRSLGTGYQIVLANIVADVILPLSGFVRRFLAPGGVFICSGILDDRAPEVEAALRRNGFAVLRRLHEEEWYAFVCR